MLTLYSAIAIILPAFVFMALHWFPWIDAINRELHRLESYVVGVATINGTALALILLSQADSLQAARLLILCTAGGGGGTLIAWGIDYIIRQRRSRRRQQARCNIDIINAAKDRQYWSDYPPTEDGQPHA